MLQHNIVSLVWETERVNEEQNGGQALELGRKLSKWEKKQRRQLKEEKKEKKGKKRMRKDERKFL